MGEVRTLFEVAPILCAICLDEDAPVIPGAPNVLRGVEGFEKKREGGGTNMIFARQVQDRWAHERCVRTVPVHAKPAEIPHPFRRRVAPADKCAVPGCKRTPEEHEEWAGG